ncbi:YdcF family protein [Thermotoga sp.]|uniref:YdcF family protein n=1 Tax=Thermotoga sp. TaxID=28240 RepID=UPI0025FF4277|nr:YdcF family protein [Thermotoga sp.]MCD6551404.1 YdcF family protein [Thermotoga sp.]
MLFQKTAGAFFVTPGAFILVLLLASIFFKKSRWFLVVLAVLLYIVSSYPGEFLFLRPLEENLTVPIEFPQNGMIIILGGGVERNTRLGDTLSDATLRRVLAGLQVHRKTGLPILVTGGSLSNLKSEALIMKEYLVSLGVSEKDILVEIRSKNTYENASFTREMIGNVPVILVTDSIHMKRALHTFKRFFSEVVPYPAGCYFGTPEFVDFLPNTTSFYLNSRAIYEWIGFIWYNLRRR